MGVHIRWVFAYGRAVVYNSLRFSSCAYENNLRIPPLEVLTDIAVFFNVSLDYLVGIDKEEMVSVDGLSNEQKEIIHAMIHEFKSGTSNCPGLTAQQQDILNKLMVEFYRKHKQ